MIPIQLTRPGQLSNGCKRTFQSSSLPLIGPQEALISTHLVPAFIRTGEDAMPQTENTLTWKVSISGPSS
ncbi:unnamed protein product [Nezara viridula]|uniref:Uncharacterized protein n=1 Tax=Nezara viridula TaxID=85310 RepID=A0A9P0E8N8_NEZVI|nr:unnamed protein product [Nezara viridula]